MTATVERMLPLYEAKMLDAYDHRDADVVKSETATKRQNQLRYLTDTEKTDPSREVMPLYWVREEVLPPGLPNWLLGFSRITSATNERTMLSSELPKSRVGDSYFLIGDNESPILLAILNSFILDYMSRLKVGGLNMSFFYVKQLPFPEPDAFLAACPWDTGRTLSSWLTPRVAFLTCTSWSLAPMALELTGQD